MVGAFNVAEPPIPRVKRTLKEVAAFCKEDHFNWYQIVQYDSFMPEVSPYVDPPHGGYPGQWADDLNWYWDESKPDPLPPTFQPRFQLSEHTHEFSLDYSDFPVPPVGGDLDIIAFLVSLDKDGKLLHYHQGFEFYLNRPEANKAVIPLLFLYIVPEPSTISLFVLAAVWLGALKLKRRIRGVDHVAGSPIPTPPADSARLI